MFSSTIKNSLGWLYNFFSPYTSTPSRRKESRRKSSSERRGKTQLSQQPTKPRQSKTPVFIDVPAIPQSSDERCGVQCAARGLPAKARDNAKLMARSRSVLRAVLYHTLLYARPVRALGAVFHPYTHSHTRCRLQV